MRNIFFKKFLNIIFFLLLIFFFIGIYQSIDYDNKYINRNSLQIDFNKIRTPFVKKSFLKTEKFFNRVFFKSNVIEIDKNNLNLPKYKFVRSNLENKILKSNINIKKKK